MVLISSKRKIVLLSLILLSFILIGLIIYNSRYSKINYTPTAYEKELMEYFKEIALESEYFDNSKKITKWDKPMKIFLVRGVDYEEQKK